MRLGPLLVTVYSNSILVGVLRAASAVRYESKTVVCVAAPMAKSVAATATAAARRLATRRCPDRFGHGGERRLDPGRIFAATLCHSGGSAAAALDGRHHRRQDLLG